MKRTFLALATCFPLAGCFQTSSDSGPQPTDITAVINGAQAQAQAFCRFVPDAATILDLMASGNSALQTPLSIAQAICNAISRPALKNKAGAVLTPSINGIAIRGRRV
jgi:hypothetical protein